MKFTESVKVVVNEHIKNPLQIVNMANKDLKKQFSGTTLGAAWPLIKNIIFVFAYWFTIQIGLKGTTKSIKQPYIVWLVIGLVPWFFIRDTLVPAASSIRKNRYLVTKTVFPTFSRYKLGFIAEKLGIKVDDFNPAFSDEELKEDVVSTLRRFAEKGDHRSGFYHFSWF